MPEYRILNVRQYESGAALVTAILVTFLLGTACIAMLSAVGASSRNTTDVLAETKAYYAAENGLQATINVLRHTTGLTYAGALSQQTAGTFPVSGPITLDDGTSYTVQISDPDDALTSTTYTAAGLFAQTETGPWTSKACFPNCLTTTANRTEITFSPPNGAPVTFNHPASSPFPQLGSFHVDKYGTGGTITAYRFKINYQMIAPRPAVRSIRGAIDVTSGAAIKFDLFTYSLSGSAIDLCPNSSCTTSGVAFANLPLIVAGGDTQVYAKIAPVDPYRLLVVATGHGPALATKRLEAIVQKNFFSDLGSGSPINLAGPNAAFTPGTSAQMEIQGGSAPSVGVCDAASLNTVNNSHTNGTLNPPPAITCDENPSWMSSPIALDAVVRQLRQTAQNSGRYFASGGPSSSQGWGNFATGTGITFCEGTCSLGGNTEGGGILVVTGTLVTSGSPKFKGLILAIGPFVSNSNPGGITRNGGGNEVFIGNIVVAPYDPNNLTSSFTLSPRYSQNGGAGDTINSNIAVDDAFNGTAAITNFVLGVAEK